MSSETFDMWSQILGCPYKKSDSYSAFKDCLQHSGSDSDLESDTLDQQEVVVEVHKVGILVITNLSTLK
jgi:hypothetical protein